MSTRHGKVRVVLKAVAGAVVVVTSTMHHSLILFLLMFSITGHTAVLPEERADALYHSYSGGGIDITGPAILVRANAGESVSLSAKHYVDTISSASIDVQVIRSSASTYEEERVENSFSIDFLNEKTLMSLSYTNSEENDFSADTFAFGISQDFFGDLTTLSMGYAHGSNVITQTGGSTFIGQTGQPTLSDVSKTDNFNLGLTQVITKNLIMAASFDVTTDSGLLNNPYRRIRYYVDATTFNLDEEVYPNTRTSNALAIRARYFLPYRAALHAEFRTFNDSWGINGTNIELGYTHPFANNWTAEAHFRTYAQNKADFYSDLFPYADAQNFMARDKELSTFNNQTIGFGISYEFANAEGGFFDKATVNFKFDHIQFNYEDFRDARQTSFTPGTEPLYKFDANIMQLFLSAWF